VIVRGNEQLSDGKEIQIGGGKKAGGKPVLGKNPTARQNRLK
jgi:hypothetical protein